VTDVLPAEVAARQPVDHGEAHVVEVPSGFTTIVACGRYFAAVHEIIQPLE
jgi:hypothetical protein